MRTPASATARIVSAPSRTRGSSAPASARSRPPSTAPPRKSPARPTPFFPVVLASQSPRRLKLLKTLVPDFTTSAATEPTRRGSDAPHAHTRRASLAKARSVSPAHPRALIIAADTVLSVRGHVLGKPRGRAQAERMLKLLSGHAVLATTSVCLLLPSSVSEHPLQWSEEAVVHFVPFASRDPDGLSAYLQSGAWAGKAGALSIDEPPVSGWVERIEGDPLAVIGLPTRRLAEVLRMLGLSCAEG